jgi:hypothetical protein
MMFEEHGVKQVIPRQCVTVILMTAARLSGDPELVIFPSETESPWVSFNVGDRRFGIWKTTLDLYEADEHGAMGEDPVNPAALAR